MEQTAKRRELVLLALGAIGAGFLNGLLGAVSRSDKKLAAEEE